MTVLKQHLNPDDHAGMLTWFLCFVLLRSGGQQTFTWQEIQDLQQDYEGLEILNDEENQQFVLTLHTRRAGVDPG